MRRLDKTQNTLLVFAFRYYFAGSDFSPVVGEQMFGADGLYQIYLAQRYFDSSALPAFNHQSDSDQKQISIVEVNFYKALEVFLLLLKLSLLWFWKRYGFESIVRKFLWRIGYIMKLPFRGLLWLLILRRHGGR